MGGMWPWGVRLFFQLTSAPPIPHLSNLPLGIGLWGHTSAYTNKHVTSPTVCSHGGRRGWGRGTIEGFPGHHLTSDLQARVCVCVLCIQTLSAVHASPSRSAHVIQISHPKPCDLGCCTQAVVVFISWTETMIFKSQSSMHWLRAGMLFFCVCVLEQRYHQPWYK